MREQPFFIPAAVLALLALPLVMGLVPRNRAYGVRTAKTLAHDGVWYSANRVAGVGVVLSSAFYFAIAFLLPYRRDGASDVSTWGVHLAAFVVPMAASIAAALRQANRAG